MICNRSCSMRVLFRSLNWLPLPQSLYVLHFERAIDVLPVLLVFELECFWALATTVGIHSCRNQTPMVMVVTKGMTSGAGWFYGSWKKVWSSVLFSDLVVQVESLIWFWCSCWEPSTIWFISGESIDWHVRMKLPRFLEDWGFWPLRLSLSWLHLFFFWSKTLHTY